MKPSSDRWPIGGQTLSEIEDAHELIDLISDLLDSKTGRRFTRGEICDLSRALEKCAWAIENEQGSDGAMVALNMAKDEVEFFYRRRR